MHIESIRFSAFKGASASYPLTPATLIIGANGAGKTTIKQAIQLAILGYIPGRSKTNRDPYMNATVGIQLSDGEHIERSYSYSGGSIKEKVQTSLEESDIETLSTPTLDSSEYFDLGPTDQVQYIFSRMELPDTHSSTGILKDLADSEFTELDASHVSEAKAKVAALAREALSLGIADGLAKLTGDKGVIGKELSYWKARAKETLGNLRIAAELQMRAGECSAETLADIREKIARNGTALAAAQREAGALSQRRMAANRIVLRKREIGDLLAKPVVDHAVAIAEHQRQIEELQRAKGVDTGTPFDVLQRHYMDKTEQRASAHAVWTAADDALKEADRGLADLEGLTECPNCGAKSKGWKLRLSTVLQTSRNEAERKLTAAREQFDRIAAEWEQAKAAADERKVIEQANRTADNSIAQRERLVERLTQEQSADASLRTALAAELERLTEADAPLPEELAESSRAVQEFEQNAKGLASKLDAATRLQHEIRQAAQGEQEHAKAKAYVAVVDDAKRKLKARQVSTIDVLFQGLIEKANYFTAGILAEPLIFRDGEIGRIIGNEFVSASDVAGFSDAERGITYVAVAAALAAQSPFRVAIIDEVKIDDVKMAQIMRRMLEAIAAGVINQAILTDTHVRDFTRDFMPEGELSWSIVELGKAVSA